MRALKELADKLCVELFAPGGLWVREVKVVGSGKKTLEVTVERTRPSNFVVFRLDRGVTVCSDGFRTRPRLG
ncbi:MAG TPA: hypothetical protein VHS28_07460 [Chloroflexota bacterium]|nr:hypothetical protein [Chloroflexota bacterium]